ncbi:protein transport protein HofC [Zophobihabitans entericus]|uniref:Protein transport protein HofC n=1 Tax=Zophobihabitans entericus TaxID=1635327 RepID=A0A6G9IDC1_9GAMM|nr:protein transport protein HofC [Zophobihabitans entericus]QIQ21837.1 protein transport protein HofC [Zophobihabitans entericus]
MTSLRIYLWQGYNQNQQYQQSEIAALSVQEARARLLLKGHLPVKIQSGPKIESRNFSRPALLLITRQLAAMLQAGLPLNSCLTLIASEHPQSQWRFILSDIEQRIAQGNTFSDSLTYYSEIFPPLYRQLIATGELTGQLEQCCYHLVIQQESSLALQKKVKKTLRYPLFLLSVSIAVTLLMLLFVLPQFATVYASFDAQLPWFTQSIISLSELLRDYFLFLPVFSLSIYLFYKKYLLLKYPYQIQVRLLQLPVIGKVLQLSYLAQIFQTLMMTQSAGIPLFAGLTATKNTLSSLVYKNILSHIQQSIEQGHSFSQSIKQHNFPSLCYQLIRIGEESGTLDLMLEKLALHFQQQTNELAEQLSQKLEPILMLVLGIIVGGLVIAMYLPIFQLGDVIH